MVSFIWLIFTADCKRVFFTEKLVVRFLLLSIIFCEKDQALRSTIYCMRFTADCYRPVATHWRSVRILNGRLRHTRFSWPLRSRSGRPPFFNYSVTAEIRMPKWTLKYIWYAFIMNLIYIYTCSCAPTARTCFEEAFCPKRTILTWPWISFKSFTSDNGCHELHLLWNVRKYTKSGQREALLLKRSCLTKNIIDSPNNY